MGKKNIRWIGRIVVLTMLFVSVQTISADLINGSFEDPVINYAPYYDDIIPTSWNWSGASIGQVYTVRLGTPPDGAQYAEMRVQEAGVTRYLWQNTGILIQEGWTYTLAFEAKDGGDLTKVRALLGRANDDSSESDTTLVDQVWDAASDWTAYSTNYTAVSADAGKYLVVLHSGLGNWCDLDDVVVTAIPEPATLGLLMAGGMLAILRRRRQ